MDVIVIGGGMGRLTAAIGLAARVARVTLPELDALWSFALRKTNKRWAWLALCRRARRIVRMPCPRPIVWNHRI